MVQVVILNAGGGCRNLKTGALTEGAAVTGAAVAKAVRKTKPAELLGSYSWKGHTLSLWGWQEGKAGTENKIALPPPYDELCLFGDAMVVSNSGAVTVDIWTALCAEKNGGVADSDSDSDSDSEADSDEDEASEHADEFEGEEEVADDVSEESDEESDEGEGGEEGEPDESESESDEGSENDDCYDEEGDGGGGAKRRAPRRRTTTDPEYRRMEMGLRSRVPLPAPLNKRVPRWHSAAELVPEPYTF